MLGIISSTLCTGAENLFTGNMKTGSWGWEFNKDCVNVSADKFSMTKAGDKIIVEALPDGNDPQVGVQSASEGWPQLDGTINQTVESGGKPIEFTLNATAVTQLKEGGLIVRGNNIAITSVNLVSSTVHQISILWEGNYEVDWGAGEAAISANEISAAEIGDIIQFSVSSIKDGALYPQLKIWSTKTSPDPIADLPLFTGNTVDKAPVTKSLEITDSNIESILAGFYVAGCDATLSRISLLKAIPSGVSELTSQDTGICDVFTLQGTIVRKNVAFKDAFTNLPKGIFIVNGKKYLVR